MAPNTTPLPGESSSKPACGDVLEVSMARMGAQGRAVAVAKRFALLCPRGLPGEQVRVAVEKVHARHALVAVLEVLRAAPERISAPCPDFSQCGGCDWLHVVYPRQLEFKHEVLTDQLTRIAGISPPPHWEITPSPRGLEYRDKLEFTVVRSAVGLEPGFHGFSGNIPVAIERCHLAPVDYTRLAQAALAALPPSFSAAGDVLPPISRLTIQSSQNQAPQGLALTLHCNRPEVARELEQAAPAFLNVLSQAIPQLEVLALRRQDRGTGRTLLRMLRGEALLSKSIPLPSLRSFSARQRFYVPIDGFFQANLPQAAAMVEQAEQLLKAQHQRCCPEQDLPLLLDLFCGAGMFSLPLAAAGFSVAGMERSGEAVRAARKTAALWGLSHCVFEAGDLARVGKLKGLLRRHGTPLGVLVNPPRSGLPARLSAELLEHAPPLLLYISCDGATFARDAARLAPGYRLSFLRGFDLFPQTHHLEIMALFQHRTAAEEPLATKECLSV